MKTGSFILLLDTWVALLQQLNTNSYARILKGPHGGRVVRIRELTQAGLMSSRHGTLGGHQLTVPFENICLRDLLVLRDIPEGPTRQFLWRYADTPLVDILSWVPERRPTWVASLETVTGIFSAMSHTNPVLRNTLRVKGVSDGYVAQVLCRAAKCGVIVSGPQPVNGGRRGSLLVKPYTEMTIADVRPLLSSRRTIYNALLAHSASLPLCTFRCHTAEGVT